MLLTFSMSLLVGVLPVGLRLADVLPPNGSPVILPLLIIDAVLGVTLVVVGLILITSMMADIVEQVQVKTGRRSEGLLYSADTMLKQIITGVGSIGTGFILQLVQFPEKATPGHVPQAVLNHLALVYLPINITTGLLAICVISFYSIKHSDHEANVAKISGA